LGALDAGRVVIEEERFNLREAIDMTTKIILEADYAKGKRLLVHCFSANDVTVFGDQKKLTQVLMNLVRTKNLSHKPLTSAQKLSNAFKFTLDGGNVELICRLSSDDKSPCYAEITIRDDGIGIDSAKLAELTRGARLEGSGVGLGVSVTRRLLEMLGGSLYINSAGRGCGVTVSCSYPLKQVQYSSSTQPLASVLDPSLRVLLVEDNSVNAIVIRKILQRLGVTRVTTSVDGDLAVEIIRKQQHRFDVILMDIRMPGKLDGIEAARLIRSLTAPKTPKIIALTADVSADVERACAGVMDRFLTKPLNVDRFSAAMKEVCKLA
jgi:CheY-like chemotaxis protein